MDGANRVGNPGGHGAAAQAGRRTARPPLWQRLSLYGRLALVVLAGGAVLFSLDMVMGVYQAKAQIQDFLAENARIEAENLAQSLSAPAAQGNSIMLEQLMRRRIDQGDLLAISYRAGRRRLFLARPSGGGGRPQWFAALVGLQPAAGEAEMRAAGRVLGRVRVTVSPLAREIIVWRVISRRAIFFFVMLLIMAYVMNRLLRDNFRGLAALRPCAPAPARSTAGAWIRAWRSTRGPPLNCALRPPPSIIWRRNWRPWCGISAAKRSAGR